VRAGDELEAAVHVVERLAEADKVEDLGVAGDAEDAARVAPVGALELAPRALL
jgi:hypothetical protein